MTVPMLPATVHLLSPCSCPVRTLEQRLSSCAIADRRLSARRDLMRPALRLNAAGKTVQRVLHGARSREAQHSHRQARIVGNVSIARDIAATCTQKKRLA